MILDLTFIIRHPGCFCEDGWDGPHCEIYEATQLAPQSVSTQAKASPSSDGGSNNTAGTVILVLTLFGIVAVLAFLVRKYRNRRTFRKSIETNTQMWKGRYQDRPPEVNIAPRRQSDLTDSVYLASIASSSDPIAAHMAPSQPEDLEDDQPQIYLGPPRDEDGHELYSVDIL